MAITSDAWTPSPILTFGWRLRLALDNAGMTLSELAEEIEMSRETVSLWANDHAEPRKEMYYRELARILACDYTWLRTGHAPSPKPPGGPGTRPANRPDSASKKRSDLFLAPPTRAFPPDNRQAA